MVEVITDLPLYDVQSGKYYSEDDNTGKVHWEAVKNSESTVIDLVLVARLAKLQDNNKIKTISTKPEEQEVSPVGLVINLSFLLHIGLRTKSFGAWRSCGRSITPRNVMQVGHRVDAENVGEHGYKDKVRDQPNSIAFKVFQEIDWSQQKRHNINSEHNYSSQHEPWKVMIALAFPNPGSRVANHVLWVKSSCRKVEDHAYDSHYSDSAEYSQSYDKTRLSTV